MMEAPHDDYKRIDYWLPLREAAVRFLTGGSTPQQFSAAISAVTDSKKISNYSAAANGLLKWMKRKNIEASPTPARIWTSSGLEVVVAPEVIVSWPNTPAYVLKLYFNAGPLSKFAANPLLRLIELTYGSMGTAAVLDAQRSKLHFGPTNRPNDLDVLLRTEASSFMSIWNAI